MKQTSLLIFTLLFLVSANAQESWQEMMMSNSNSYAEIKAAFSENATNKTYEKGKGWKQYYRWSNFWENRLMPDGTFPNVFGQFKKQWNSSSNKGNSNGNWMNVGPFYHETTSSWSSGSGRVNVIQTDPNIPERIYVGAPAGGLWRSDDNGNSWTPLADQLASIGISQIVIDPTDSQVIYLGTGDRDGGNTFSIGLVKSTDGGVTWNMVGPDMGKIHKVVMDPNDNQKLWIASKNGLYKSADAGNTWDVILTSEVSELIYKPIGVNTFYIISGSTCYYTSDNGNTFSVSEGLPASSGRIVLAVTPADPNIVYLLAAKSNYSFNGIYKSVDSGMSFELQNGHTDIFEASSQAWYNMALAVSDINPNLIFAGSINIWQSLNGGQTISKLNSWSAPNSENYTHADIHFLEYQNELLYCGSDGGVYCSNNNGASFTDLSGGLSIGQFYSIAITGQDGTIAGGLQDNGSYVLADDGNWKNYIGADGMESGIDPNNPKHVFGMIQNGGLYETYDGGNTIVSLGQPSAASLWVTPLAMDPEGGRLLAGYDHVFEYNFEDGWHQLSDFDFGGKLSEIEIQKNNSSAIFVAAANKIYKSLNNGSTWLDITGSLNGNIASMEIHPEDENVLWVAFHGYLDGEKVFTTSDGGNSWVNISGDLPNINSNTIIYDSSSDGLYLGNDRGVYFMAPDSDSWIAFDENLPNVIVTDLEINQHEEIIQIATFGRGIWQSPLYGVDVHDFDVAVTEIVSPDQSVCGSTANIEVLVENVGSSVVSNLEVHYQIQDRGWEMISWEGELSIGQTAIISISNVEILASDNALNIDLKFPNGELDGNRTNNISTTSFQVNSDGNNGVFALQADCYAGETSWSLFNDVGDLIYQEEIGAIENNTNNLYEFCLETGCYFIVINDSYGDGLSGSSSSCAFDGDYSFINQGDTLFSMPQADFGDQVTHDFCVYPNSEMSWIFVPPTVQITCDELPLTEITGIPLVSTNCEQGEIILSYEDDVELYQINRNWTASDSCGQAIEYVQEILIVDDVLPIVICSENVSVSTSDTEIYIEILTPEFSDNCGIMAIENDFNFTDNASDYYLLGTTEVTWQVTDEFGNQETCIQEIIVEEDVVNGISELHNSTEINVYPNPTSGGELFIQSSNRSQDFDRLIITNLVGEVVHSQNNIALKSNTSFKVSLPNQISEGVYLLVLEKSQKRAVQLISIIKE